MQKLLQNKNNDYMPLGYNIYWRSDSGWGRPDIVTVSRRYRYIAVDYKYESSGMSVHSVISHEYFKKLVSDRGYSDCEVSDKWCLHPVTAAHPFMKSLDFAENDGKTYTVLLHQRSVERKKLKYNGYYEVLDNSERDLPYADRKRWILDPNGRLLDGGITGKNVKTRKRSNTPTVVLKKWS